MVVVVVVVVVVVDAVFQHRVKIHCNGAQLCTRVPSHLGVKTPATPAPPGALDHSQL